MRSLIQLQRWVLRTLVWVSVFTALPGECGAQSALFEISPLGRGQNGWSFYSASASFGYSTLAQPNNAALPSFVLDRLESDYDGTASASMGYNYNGSGSKISLLYTPSYVRRVQYADLKSFNQMLNFTFSRSLSPRMDLSISAVGTDSTLDQLLFAPAILSATTTPAATLDDLLQSSRSGLYSSDQLASILTGTPYVATPSRSVVYGSSFLSISGNADVSYRFSSRLSFNVNAGATRSQTRNDSRTDLQGQLNFLIPRSTMERAGVGLNYSLTPRTQLGVVANSTRVESSLSRIYVSNTALYLSRKLTTHWFGSVQGGVGVVTELSGTQSGSSPTPSYTAQGSVGYTTRAHSWLGSYGRMVSDTYGFGSRSSETLAGSWQWRPVGHSWVFYASGGSQRLTGGLLGDLRFWYSNTGVAKVLTQQFSVNFTYAYVARPTDAGNASGVLQQSLSGYSTRVTLVWSPHSQEGHLVSVAAGAAGGSGGGTGPVR